VPSGSSRRSLPAELIASLTLPARLAGRSTAPVMEADAVPTPMPKSAASRKWLVFLISQTSVLTAASQLW
jgi:hypothetical protein